MYCASYPSSSKGYKTKTTPATFDTGYPGLDTGYSDTGYPTLATHTDDTGYPKTGYPTLATPNLLPLESVS
ncbi:hypothetical protein DAPPUDRAFT_323198 [Daphnia pulex]|uniref:Uncharacterized protein n=1 Tax=Daphnia pulex TaxID=6669 RepID=E9GY62_DAPPU|nr:hypothetical protein DAPPUDRAFT_323198 [Daphnia pulex]|eukprot:EFX75545.1 hypothetical protein DAPPUDRAFT_323198 [Daphnia pulex]